MARRSQSSRASEVREQGADLRSKYASNPPLSASTSSLIGFEAGLAGLPEAAFLFLCHKCVGSLFELDSLSRLYGYIGNFYHVIIRIINRAYQIAEDIDDCFLIHSNKNYLRNIWFTLNTYAIMNRQQTDISYTDLPTTYVRSHTKTSVFQESGLAMKHLKNAATLLLVTLLCFTLMPALPGDMQSAEALPIQDGIGTVDVNTSTATTIGFGGHEWYAIARSGDTLTLLAKDDDFGTAAFNDTGSVFSYNGGALQIAMQSIYNVSLGGSKEQTLVLARNDLDAKDNGAGTETLTGQYFWPLSTAEANSVALALRPFSNDLWWLRSPGNDAPTATAVEPNGIIYASGYNIASNLFVRPAFNLNLKSVLFTSAASVTSGKNSVVEADGFVTATPTIDAIKLTVEDTSLSLTTEATSVSGNVITFDYTISGTAGTYNRLSAIVKDTSTGKIVSYANLMDGPGASGRATVIVPTLEATQKLLVFAEQVNGENLTDFASEPKEITTAAPSINPPGQAGGGSGLAKTGDSPALPITAGILALGGAALLVGYVLRRRGKRSL